MKILIIGQCTLHWGRMEFGNIGNYYIMEPLIRELHNAFGPNLKLNTTFQMSEGFCKKEKLEVLPMELYYGWKEDDLSIALEELAVATIFNKTGNLIKKTPFIEAVLNSDLIIDFSGDIWGDNADFLGNDRFMVGLLKDRTSQLLNKKTVMLAGSPGPFDNKKNLNFAKEVFENFDLVTNREAISIDLLNNYGFKTDHVKSLSCPAFLFEPTSGEKRQDLLKKEGLLNRTRPIVGFIVCGWNFENGPFDKWPREDNEYTVFAEAIEYLINKLDVDVCLMSHSNGFPIPPAEFKLLHGRDYPVSKQLQKVVYDRGIVNENNVFTLDGIYDTWNTKAIISSFDMLVSGRIHAAVAGLSQHVPTVIIDYGHEPKAHKLKGFAQVAGVLDLVADPSKSKELINKIDFCWTNKAKIKSNLEASIIDVKEKAKQNFKVLKGLFS